MTQHRYLARCPPSPDSPLAPLAEDPAWQRQPHYFDQIFAREDARLSKVRAFSKENFLDEHETMLYMFDDPDFLYATSFFLNAFDLCDGRPGAQRQPSAIDRSTAAV